MISTVFDDIANERHIAPVLARAEAGERELPLSWLEKLAAGTAAREDRERHGEHWTVTLVELLERGRVGRLERQADGRVVFAFASELPTAEEAWARAWATGAKKPRG